MSQKIKNPQEKGNGFLIGIIAVIAVVVVVIGAVVYIGRNQPIGDLPNDEVNFAVSVENNVVRLARDDAGNAPVAEVYEDVNCPYCAQLALEGSEDELAALNDGTLVVEHHGIILPSLDQATDGFSTRGLAALRDIAKAGEAKVYWNFHNMIMENQQQAYRWDNDELADRVEALGGSTELVAQIRAGVDEEGATAAATDNATKLERKSGQVSTPQVFVGDEDITSQVNGRLGDWVKVILG